MSVQCALLADSPLFSRSKAQDQMRLIARKYSYEIHWRCDISHAFVAIHYNECATDKAQNGRAVKFVEASSSKLQNGKCEHEKRSINEFEAQSYRRGEGEDSAGEW